MGTGYTRNDVSNNIADGNVINAADLDGEFDAIVDAFNSITGHTHDGTSAEGGPITVVGPAQDLVVSGTSVLPKTDNTLDLGSGTFEFKDLYIDGTANIDSLVADTADINGGTIDASVIGGVTPAAGSFTTLAASGGITGALTGNASTATALQTGRTIGLTGDVTATGVSFDGTANITLITVVGNDSHNHTLSTITDAGTMAAQNSASVTITGGSISGITDLAVADGGTGASTAADALINLGLTATATELNVLDGVTATTAELNYVDGVTSNIQTQLDAKAATSAINVANSSLVKTALNASGSAPIYACRAWVVFDGTTGTIAASGNVTSVTRNSTGNYTINLTTAIEDTNYAVVAQTGSLTDTASVLGIPVTGRTTSTITILVRDVNANQKDSSYVSVAVFR